MITNGKITIGERKYAIANYDLDAVRDAVNECLRRLGKPDTCASVKMGRFGYYPEVRGKWVALWHSKMFEIFGKTRGHLIINEETIKQHKTKFYGYIKRQLLKELK